MTDARAAFDMDGAGVNDPPTHTARHSSGEHRQGRKRRKYAARACDNCKRRKVRCSGDDECDECRSRELRCHYPPALQQLPTDGMNGSSPRSQSTAPHAVEAASSAAWASPSCSDPRVDGLCDRVAALERMLNHVVKSDKVGDGAASGSSLQKPIRVQVSHADEDEDDQFAIQTTAHDDVTVSSQVAAMSALLSKPPSPRPGGTKQSAGVEFLVEFPEPPALQHLLDVYFCDMDSYFPFLDRQDTETRIYRLIRRLGYSSYNRLLVVPIEDRSTVALACIMMALAECLDPGEGACDGATKPGWERYQQSCRLLQRFSKPRTVDLDVVRAQCLVAAYLMQCERLNAASGAVSVTWRLATSIRLHNKRAWPDNDADMTLHRQKLWWTIYFLDRQISRRSGTPYHIRDTEFQVDDFTSIENAAETDWCSRNTKLYLQALTNLARLWGHIWDNCFAVGAKHKGDWMELEIMDARILNTRRLLPKTLTWDSQELDKYILNGEDDVHIRRRLSVFTRLELLRMLIRQNPIRQIDSDPENPLLCARLSREVISAHKLYISRSPGARAVGYFSTSSTVECIYHLVSVMHRLEDTSERMDCVTAFDQAHGILLRLSAYCNVAKRALNALSGVFRKWGTVRGTGSATDVSLMSDSGESRLMDTNLQFHDVQGDYLQFGADGFNVDNVDNVDLSEWMDVSLGAIDWRDFDFQTDSQLRDVGMSL